MNCPGWYCGRTVLLDGNYSACLACARGFRRDDDSICQPCTDSPIFYDWLYLGFMVLLVFILQLFFIDKVTVRRKINKEGCILYTIAILETLLSATLTLLTTHPVGHLGFTSCRVRSLSDWYTLLHNPMPDYEKQIHCTQEAVYPLNTMVFTFYAYDLFIMLMLRPWICCKYIPRQSKMSIYAAMYFLPILSLIHALFGGLLYYSFPYLVVVLSLTSCATHFSLRTEQTMSLLISTTLTDPRNIIILFGHWCLHAFGIISISQFSKPFSNLLLILLVPLPSLFYILTSNFTDPQKIVYI